MPKPVVQPYLMFNGHCEAAMKFYEKATGAKIECIMRYKDAPEQPGEGMVPPNYGDKVMHGALTVGDTLVMLSDYPGKDADFAGFSLSFGTESIEEADRAFAALSEGGTVTMPLDKTFWSPRFGMLTDKFGVSWMVNVNDPECMK